MSRVALNSKNWIIVIGAGALVAAAAVAGWMNYRMTHVDPGIAKVNGRLEVDRLEIATQFAGQVLSVPVQEGQYVKAGDVIAQLDPKDYEAQLQGVKAMAQRADQAYQRASGERQVRAEYLRVAQLDLSNTQTLRHDDLVSEAELDKRVAQRDGERAGVSVASAAMGEARAARAEAEAGMTRLRQAIADHTLRAPVDGRIEYRVVEPGAVIPQGGRVATLLDLNHVYMTVFLPTARAGRLRVGDEARLVLDAAPECVLPARISFVADEAQFTPKYVETQSEREKLMYRVKLSIDPALARRYSSLIKAGMTGDGYVKVDPGAAWPQRLAVRLPAD